MGSMRVIRETGFAQAIRNMGFVQAIRETASVSGMAHGHIFFVFDSAAELAYGSDSPRSNLSKTKKINMA